MENEMTASREFVITEEIAIGIVNDIPLARIPIPDNLTDEQYARIEIASRTEVHQYLTDDEIKEMAKEIAAIAPLDWQVVECVAYIMRQEIPDRCQLCGRQRRERHSITNGRWHRVHLRPDAPYERVCQWCRGKAKRLLKG